MANSLRTRINDATTIASFYLAANLDRAEWIEPIETVLQSMDCTNG